MLVCWLSEGRQCTYNLTLRVVRIVIVAVEKHHHHYHHHHHHLVNMQLEHLLISSGLTLLQVSLMVSPGSFCLLVCSFLLFSAICYEAFCLYVANNVFCVPVFCPKLGFCLVLLQSLCLCCNPSEFILLFVSCISYLLLLFFLHLLLWWFNFHSRITELEGTVCCIVLFLFSLKLSVV